MAIKRKDDILNKMKSIQIHRYWCNLDEEDPELTEQELLAHTAEKFGVDIDRVIEALVFGEERFGA